MISMALNIFAVTISVATLMLATWVYIYVIKDRKKQREMTIKDRKDHLFQMEYNLRSIDVIGEYILSKIENRPYIHKL